MPVPGDAAFSGIGTGTVTETVAQGAAYSTLTYVQPSGSSLYALSSASTSFIDPGSSTTRLDVESGDRMQFTIDGSGHVTAEQKLDAHGVAHSFTPDSHTSFTQLAPGYVEETRTVGTHSSYEVFYADPAAGGVYTAVAHGSGATVDLTGLEAQLNQLPAATLHLL